MLFRSAAFEPFLKAGLGGDEEKSEAASEAVTDDMSTAMMNYMPLRGMLSFGGDPKVVEMVEGILKQLNG